MNEMNTDYTTYAFISYSHKDMAVAKWLQKRLEGFKLPTEIHNDIDAKTRYLRPIFRDQSDLNTGVLGDELRKHLEESKFLLLICSKNSAGSAWVSDEARAFVEIGRLERIIPVIIPDGATPERELFPKYLREYFAEHPDKELLGVNIGEVGKEKALVRVVSRMLGVSFDSLWKRHQRHQRMRIASWTVGGALALAGAYLFAVPVEVTVDIELQRSALPLGETVTLDIDGGEYTSGTAGPKFEPVRVPGYKRFSTIAVSARSQYFESVDTTVSPGFGARRAVEIYMLRDSTFGVFEGTVYDAEMNPLADVSVEVADHCTHTDASGHFSIMLPLCEQLEEQEIHLTKEGYQPIRRTDETPGRELKFVMRRGE